MRYFLNKLFILLTTLMLISIMVFLVFQVLPGDPVMIILGIDADPYQVELMKERLQTDLPIYERYFNWIKGAIKGDLGESIQYSGIQVLDLIKARIPVTLHVGLFSIFISLLIGIPLGVFVGKYFNKPLGKILSIFTQIGLAIPTFWLGIILVLIFSIVFSIFPSGGYIPLNQDVILSFKSVFLPALSLSVGNIALIVRFLKNSILENKKEDYVRMAKSKGRTDNGILIHHILRNALIPVITVIGMVFAETLSGTIIIENVFNLAGIGLLMVNAIGYRDFPLIQALSLYIASVVVITNFLIDILYKTIDPRMREG